MFQSFILNTHSPKLQNSVNLYNKIAAERVRDIPICATALLTDERQAAFYHRYHMMVSEGEPVENLMEVEKSRCRSGWTKQLAALEEPMLVTYEKFSDWQFLKAWLQKMGRQAS